MCLFRCGLTEALQFYLKWQDIGQDYAGLSCKGCKDLLMAHGVRQFPWGVSLRRKTGEAYKEPEDIPGTYVAAADGCQGIWGTLRSMPLCQPFAVWRKDQGDVGIERGRCAEHGRDVKLPWHGRQYVRAAHDGIDAHGGIVSHCCQLVSPDTVRAAQCKVAAAFVKREYLLAEDPVVKCECAG